MLRSRCAALAAAACVAAALFPSPPVAAASVFGFTRTAGSDRYATAGLLATAAFPGGAASAIVASGFDTADAEAASYLAGVDSSPILLVAPSGPLPAATVAALAALRVRHVTLVGLDAAIGRDVQAALATTPTTDPAGGDLVVQRIGGDTRYDTMNLIDELPGPPAVGTVSGVPTAIVASGVTFADALAAGPEAYAAHLPLVLTDPASLSVQALVTLQDLGIQQVVIAGGPLAISPAVEGAIHQLGITTLARFAGTDRTDTARLLGDWAIAHLGFNDRHFDMATGDDASAGADALALAPLAARDGPRTVQLLRSAATVGSGTPQFVRDNLATLSGDNDNTVSGGGLVVPSRLVQVVVAAYFYGGGATALPELVGAEVVTTTPASAATPAEPAGTLVRFVFDSALSGAVASDRFLLYDAMRPELPASGAIPNGAVVDPVDPDAVLVNFPTLTGSAATANLSLAAVRSGAVSGLSGGANPDGAVAIGHPHPVAPPPGATEAPAPLNVAGLRPMRATGSAVGTTALDVTFDKAAFSQVAGGVGVSIVYTDQIGPAQEARCEGPDAGSPLPSGGIVPGGDGTSQWTIICPDDPNSPADELSQPQVGRVVIAEGTAGTAPPGAGSDVVATATEVTSLTHAHTPSPDLIAANVLPPARFGAEDRVVLTFDENVMVAPSAALGVSAMLANGAPAHPLSVDQASFESSQVIVSLAPGTGANVALVGVGAGVVSAAGVPNADDELMVGNATVVRVQPGQTEGPALASAVLSPGGPGTEQAALTFDQSLPGPALPPLDHVHGYDADGTELTCSSLSRFPDPATPAVVRCETWAAGPAPGGPAAPLGLQQSIVLVTVDAGVVANGDSQYNPEQAVATSGGTGIPRQS